MCRSFSGCCGFLFRFRNVLKVDEVDDVFDFTFLKFYVVSFYIYIVINKLCFRFCIFLQLRRQIFKLIFQNKAII